MVPALNGVYDVPVTGSIGQSVDLVIQLVRPDLVAQGKAHPTADILGKFFATGTDGPSGAFTFSTGQLPFKFFDDAHVLSASLELTRAPAVPIPAALPLYGTGLAVMGFLGWRKRRKAAA